MILFPKIYIDAAFNGIMAWALNVLPSVLPFMFFSKVLSSLGITSKISKIFAKPCQKLWGCTPSCSTVFLTSIISGYPVGATMTADLYKRGLITKSEAFRMCSFCSTSGPMFIIGTVASSMLGNVAYGYIIFAAHILGAILNGILYRKVQASGQEKTKQGDLFSTPSSLTTLVQDSVLSILSVGAIISVFFVVITAFAPLFNFFPPQISCFLQGIVEITKGCSQIAEMLSGFWAVVLSTLVISFGGISTILQSIAMLSKINMPVGLFVTQKITHALLSGILVAILFFVI